MIFNLPVWLVISVAGRAVAGWPGPASLAHNSHITTLAEQYKQPTLGLWTSSLLLPCVRLSLWLPNLNRTHPSLAHNPWATTSFRLTGPVTQNKDWQSVILLLVWCSLSLSWLLSIIVNVQLCLLSGWAAQCCSPALGTISDIFYISLRPRQILLYNTQNQHIGRAGEGVEGLVYQQYWPHGLIIYERLNRAS